MQGSVVLDGEWGYFNVQVKLKRHSQARRKQAILCLGQVTMPRMAAHVNVYRSCICFTLTLVDVGPVRVLY